ncbi:MAG: DNA adenine methylase [Bacteroidales bacterium]
MKTPITYYGGKQLLAKQIAGLIPAHKIYCEPYFGGGAIFFAKSKSYLEVINDTNSNLITFFSVLRDDYTNLKRLISDTLHSEAIYKSAKEIYHGKIGDVSDLELAWSVWVVTNGSFGGKATGGWKWCNGQDGSHTGIYLRGKRDDLSKAVSNRLKEVQISCRDAVRVIHDRDSTDTFFYLDPPYPSAFQGHYNGFSMLDLFNLLQKLESLKGKFILSNYWSQTLKYFFTKNNWHLISITSTSKITNLGIRSVRKKETKKKTEILVMNFIPDVASQCQLDF